jgi:hypothetical protein
MRHPAFLASQSFTSAIVSHLATTSPARSETMYRSSGRVGVSPAMMLINSTA